MAQVWRDWNPLIDWLMQICVMQIQLKRMKIQWEVLKL
jgi:hypothetical protein